MFIRDVRKDLGEPRLPFVIGVLGVNGPTDQYGRDQKRYQAIHQNFRNAMAAPASLPEFQGNVAAVFTEKFWDQQVVRLRDREKTIKPEIEQWKQAAKQGEITKDQSQSAIDKLYNETFNAEELEILRDSTSNFDFHYMGSAGIMAQIGKAFAETMTDLQATRTPANVGN